MGLCVQTGRGHQGAEQKVRDGAEQRAVGPGVHATPIASAWGAFCLHVYVCKHTESLGIGAELTAKRDHCWKKEQDFE